MIEESAYVPGTFSIFKFYHRKARQGDRFFLFRKTAGQNGCPGRNRCFRICFSGLWCENEEVPEMQGKHSAGPVSVW